jgi:murein DD-endopeptidase MepM/ murein hydrolase activator NlpD
VFSPIAKGYGFSHYDDFGNGRSFGYRRKHLGNDLMGSVGTPIIAIESGTVEVAGWNMYGGWRVGIRSFDKKRYYYYAHLRKGHPFPKSMAEGQIVKAGDVIGYLGMTGYSRKENVNNINVPHLHMGIQLIFDECQKDGINQIWIDVYNIVELLRKNRSEVAQNAQTKDFYRVYDIHDSSVPD